MKLALVAARRSLLKIAPYLLIVSSLIAILSFGLAYWSKTSPKDYQNIQCAGPSYSRSADGLVLIAEADINCSGPISKQKRQEEKLQRNSIAIGALFTAISVCALYLLLKQSKNRPALSPKKSRHYSE